MLSPTRKASRSEIERRGEAAMDDPIAHLAILNGAVAPRSTSFICSPSARDVEIAGLVGIET